MIKEETVRDIVQEHFEGTDKFVVDVKVKSGNKIVVFIDGDHGITIDDCRDASRFIESRLDRDKEDFELNVSSSGADAPLHLHRQYPRHIGRMVEVTQLDMAMLRGKLSKADDGGIEIEIAGDKKSKEPPVSLYIPFDQIKQTRIILSFK